MPEVSNNVTSARTCEFGRGVVWGERRYCSLF